MNELLITVMLGNVTIASDNGHRVNLYGSEEVFWGQYILRE